MSQTSQLHPTSKKSTRLEERKRELDLAIEKGNWTAVSELAVLTTDESFVWTNPDNELNMTNSDAELSLNDSTREHKQDNTDLHAGLIRPQSLTNGTGEQGTPTLVVNNSLQNYVELEDPSSLFVSIEHGDLPSTGDGSGRPERWIILALTCVVTTGVYYSLDNPAALHQELKDYMPPSLKFEFRFNLLYSVYSIPNMVLPFFAGNIVDRLGASRCLLGCAVLTMLGQFWFAIGTARKSWTLMLLGRTVYGFGGESSCVAYSTLLSRWFAGGEVAFSFGVALAISRLGSVLNNFLSPWVAHSASTPWALWTGLLLNGLSTLMALFILIVDQRHDRRQVSNGTDGALSEALLPVGEPNISGDEHALQEGERRAQDHEKRVHFSDILKFGPLFWLLSISCLVVYGCVLPFNNVASGILMERNYFRKPPADCTLEFPDQCTNGSLQNQTNPSTNSKGELCPLQSYAPVLPTSLNITDSAGKPLYVFDSLSQADVDCNSLFWNAACTKDFCDAQNEATEKSGRVMSIPYFMSAVLSPAMGHVVDKIGQRAVLASLSSFTLLFVHLTLGLSKIAPLLPLFGQGMAYALYAAVLWPSVPITVGENVTGTAFGIIVSVQNIGLSLFPLVIAAIYGMNDHRYIPSVELFFVICATAGVGVGTLLNLLDRKSGNKLNGVDGGESTGVSVQSEETVFSDVHAENIIGTY